MSDLISEPVSLKYDNKPGSPLGGDGCPSVQLSCPEVLKFPEHFVVTFEGHRGQIVAKSATRHEPASATATLHLTCLCSVEEAEAEPENEAEEYRDSPIDSLFKRAQEEPEETEEE